MTIELEPPNDRTEWLTPAQARQARASLRLPALMLVLSSLLTLYGAVRHGTHFWGDDKFGVSLLLLAAAIVMCFAALNLSRKAAIVKAAPSRTLWYQWSILGLLIALHLFVAHRYMNSRPVTIDCYSFQRDAAATLIEGRNPFGTTHANPYDESETRLNYAAGMVANNRVLVGMPYPPVNFLSVLPGYLLGDVRYGYVAAMLLSAVFIFVLLPDARGLSLVAFVLMNPVTFFVERQCWTEPLLWLLLCATMYAAVKKPRWLPVALGLFLASKQYNFLALPFLGFLVERFTWKAYLKLLGLSLAIATATVLPFAIWNFPALWHDLLVFHLGLPPRQDSISFAIAFPIFKKIGALFLAAFIVWGARRGAQPASLFPAVYGMAMLLFFSASTHAFINYYFVISQAFLLTAAALWPVEKARMLPSDSGNAPGAKSMRTAPTV